MKPLRPHYLYGNSAHLLDGEYKQGVRSRGDRNPTSYSRDTNVRQVRIYEYILSTAQFLTHNSSLRAPGERGRARAGEEHTTTSGFICASVAAIAYVALLTGNRPAQEKALLRDANPDLVEKESEAAGPRLSRYAYVNQAEGLAFFRKSAVALLGVEYITKLERDTGDGEPGPRLPSFMAASLDAFSQTEWRKAYETDGGRSIRNYYFAMPAHIMSILTYAYRVKWGSQPGFLQRVFFHLAKLTLEHEQEWRASLAIKPGLPAKDPLRNAKIDWHIRGGRDLAEVDE